MLIFCEFYCFDNYLDVGELEQKFTYKEGANIVLKALEILGNDYVATLKIALSKGWIDVYENEGKRSGAYSAGAYGTHPYVLLNHNDTLDNMFTLAHEMGHAMHGYYSIKNQIHCFEFLNFQA